MDDRQVQIGKMEKQLEQWRSELDDLASKVTSAGAKAKAEERELVSDLKRKQGRAKAKLAELKAARGDKWNTLKTGVESAYKELEASFKKLKN